MRVSVTNLETFRLFQTEDWMSHDDLMASLLGEEPQNLKMAASEAFHDLLRRADTGLMTYERAGRFAFDLTLLNEDMVLQPLRELRAAKTYVIGDESVEVRGRVDGANGVTVDDHKIKFSTFDAERYADSVQWKLYLDMLGGSIFNYNVFIAKDSVRNEEAWNDLPCGAMPSTEPEPHDNCPYDTDGAPKEACGQCDSAAMRKCDQCGALAADHTPIEIELREFNVLKLYAYPEMHEDVIALLTDYVQFARQHLTEEAKLQWYERVGRAQKKGENNAIENRSTV